MPRSSEVKIVPNPVSEIGKQTKTLSLGGNRGKTRVQPYTWLTAVRTVYISQLSLFMMQMPTWELMMVWYSWFSCPPLIPAPSLLPGVWQILFVGWINQMLQKRPPQIYSGGRGNAFGFISYISLNLHIPEQCFSNYLWWRINFFKVLFV